MDNKGPDTQVHTVVTCDSMDHGHEQDSPKQADRDQARAKGIRTPPPGRGRRRAAREARGCSLLWGRNNPIYTSTLTQATRGEAGGQCYLSLINLAVRSGGRGLLSTREGRPFALSRVAQKHDMRAGTTMDAHSPETDNNNNLRKKETTKVIAVAEAGGRARRRTASNTGGKSGRRATWHTSQNR